MVEPVAEAGGLGAGASRDVKACIAERACSGCLIYLEAVAYPDQRPTKAVGAESEAVVALNAGQRDYVGRSTVGRQNRTSAIHVNEVARDAILAAVERIPRRVEAVGVKFTANRPILRFIASLAKLAVSRRAKLTKEINTAAVDYFEERDGARETVVVLIEVPADAVAGDDATVREVEQIAGLADDAFVELVVDYAVGPKKRLVEAGVANQFETDITHHAHPIGRIGH